MKIILTLLVAISSVTTSAYELNWTTVDGGGVTWATGIGFTLGATVGQPDTGVATGDGFRLEGGFWTGVFDDLGWLWPSLRIALASGIPHVYWPMEATNWILQVSVNPLESTWNNVTNQPQLTGIEWRVPSDSLDGAYFRLENIIP